MASQGRAAALFNGRHDLELAQAQMTTLSLAPVGAVGAEDVGDFQGGVRQGAAYAGCSFSSGLTTSCRISVATCA